MSECVSPQEFENLLLQFLFTDKEAQNRTLPFLKAELFDNFSNKEIVIHILEFNDKYNKFPKIPELRLLIKNQDVYNHLTNVLNKDISDIDKDFVKDELESFFRNKLYKAELFRGIEGLKEGDEDVKSSIPDSLRDAYSFSFDTSVGFDYFHSGEMLYEALHETDKIIHTGIKSIDHLIQGGVHEKTLTLFMAETNMGKSLIKTALASNFLLQNKNVLYVTLEMSEKKVAERITANLFDSDINDLISIPRDRFIKSFEKVKNTIKNRLVIKEFPTRTANTNRLRNLVKELYTKSKFVPDIMIVDYLGIMIPNRFNKGANSNTELKVVSEELRGLSMEYGFPIISSLQTNRGGFGEVQLDLTDVADSIGTTTTADIIFGVSQTPELRDIGHYNFILLKNRYGINKIVCPVGVDYVKMRLYDLDNDMEEGIILKSKIVSPLADTSVNSASEISRRKDKIPKGAVSTEIVDESVIEFEMLKKQNRKKDRDDKFNIRMDI